MGGRSNRRFGAALAFCALAATQAFAQQDLKLVELRTRVMVATQPYQDAIVFWSNASGVDPALVAAIITVESRGNPNATSGSGAMGLMQLMPATCADYGVQNPFDPVANIKGGTSLLARHLRRYAGDLQKVMAAYNAGPRHADDGSWTSFAETRKYVPLVLAYYAALRPGGDGLGTSANAPTTPPATPLPATPPIQVIDRMFDAIQRRQSDLGPGQVAENMSLHDAASQLLLAYLDGECTVAQADKRAAREVAKASFKAASVKAFVLSTPDADGFAAAWAATAPPYDGLVGLAHGTSRSGHVWVVILATQGRG